MPTFMLLLTVALSVFLILLILIQRGRGGGLAGAFGGAGGQSAIGTRAGDVFTRITIVVILLWFILNAVTGIMMRSETKVYRGTKQPSKASSDNKSIDSKPTTPETTTTDEEATSKVSADNGSTPVDTTPKVEDSKPGTSTQKSGE